MTAPAPRPAAADTCTVPLTSRDIEEIEGIADLGMPIGGTLVGRLCADWRRLTAERDAALSPEEPRYRAWAAAMVADRDAALIRAIRAEAERDAARAALPDAETLDRAATTIEGGGYHYLALELSDAAARIRALDLDTAPVAAEAEVQS